MRTFATNSLSTLNAGQTLNLWFSTSAPNLTSLLLGGGHERHFDFEHE